MCGILIKNQQEEEEEEEEKKEEVKGEEEKEKKYKWPIDIFKCSASLDVREVQVNTTLKFNLTSVRK